MKKVVCFALAIMMLLCACGSKGTAAEAKGPTEPAAAAAATEVSEAAPEAAPEDEDKTVVVDNDDVAFTITGTHVDEEYGFAVDCRMENKTDTKAYFTWMRVKVDGTDTDPFWGENIPAGESLDTSIYLFDFQDAEKVEFTLLAIKEIKPGTYDFENYIYKGEYTFETFEL